MIIMYHMSYDALEMQQNTQYYYIWCDKYTNTLTLLCRLYCDDPALMHRLSGVPTSETAASASFNLGQRDNSALTHRMYGRHSWTIEQSTLFRVVLRAMKSYLSIAGYMQSTKDSWSWPFVVMNTNKGWQRNATHFLSAAHEKQFTVHTTRYHNNWTSLQAPANVIFLWDISCRIGSPNTFISCTGNVVCRTYLSNHLSLISLLSWEHSSHHSVGIACTY